MNSYSTYYFKVLLQFLLPYACDEGSIYNNLFHLTTTLNGKIITVIFSTVYEYKLWDCFNVHWNAFSFIA